MERTAHRSFTTERHGRFSATQTKSLPTKDNDWQEIAAELADGNELYVWKPDQKPVTDGSGTAKKPDSGLAEIAQKAQAKQDGTDIERGSEETTFDRPANELISIRGPEDTESSCTVFRIISGSTFKRRELIRYISLLEC